LHFNVSFDLQLNEEDVLSLLMRQQMGAHPALAAAVNEMDLQTGVGGAAQQAPTEPPPKTPSPPPPPEPQPEPQPQPEPVAEARTPAPASPRSHRAKAAAPESTNGKTPPAPPIVIPAEADMRALLSKVNAVHPAKIVGVMALLEEHGGFKRLNECPKETWPKIWEVAEAIVAAASV
jgi:hypothetical protein